MATASPSDGDRKKLHRKWAASRHFCVIFYRYHEVSGSALGTLPWGARAAVTGSAGRRRTMLPFASLHQRDRRRPSGFTLIELLVVIAILSALAGILVPVFARARASAR